MPKSDAELKKLIEQARKSDNAADRALKELTDIKVPQQARKAKKGLVARLRAISAWAGKHIPIWRARLKARRKDGPARAVKEAKSLIGTREQPLGSNWGGKVEKFIRFTGYTFPVYWCGCFVAWCVVKKGGAKIPTRIRLGYGPYICQDASVGANGLRKVSFSDIKPGDILVYWGGQHIGLAVGKPNGSTVATVEGNTSDASASNGDGVYARVRSSSDITCAARPTY